MSDYNLVDNTSQNPPIVSVAMLTYNHQDYITEAIESVLMQITTFNVQIVIAEDCSPDNTRQIVLDYQKRYPDKIKLILQTKNVGTSKNNITLFENLNGKYIAALEGDDYWTDPVKLQKQVDYLEANEEYVLCFHPVKILKPDGSLVEDFITKVPEDYETQETLARLGNYIHTPSVVFRNIIKTFPPEFALSPIGDYFLFMILTNHGKIKMLEDKMAVYRYGVGAFSAQANIRKPEDGIKLFGLLMSCSTNTELNQIFFERQINAIEYLEKEIRSEYESASFFNTIFFRIFKSLQEPTTIWKKIKSRF